MIIRDQIQFLTLMYYYLLNFFESVRSYIENKYVELRNWALDDGEVIYKSYVNTYTPISHIVYNHDTWMYILYACIVKRLNLNYYLDYFRKTDTYKDVFLHSHATNMIVYIQDGKLKYAIKQLNLVLDTPHDTSPPEAFLAMIDGCYCVTNEYNAVRDFLSGEIGLVVTNLLLSYIYKKEFRILDTLNMKELTIMRKDTLEEMVFKKYDRM